MDTAGKVTIGFGRNLDDVGISQEEAEFMFNNDLLRCRTNLAPYPWFYMQPENVQDALLNMCFNLGLGGLMKFKKMIAALNEKNYTKAAQECLDSKWAAQVGARAKDVALMIRQGHA